MSAKNKNPRQSNFFDTCSKCRTNYSCCNNTTPPITDKRRKTIEAYLKAEEISLENPFVKTDYVFPRLDSDGYCIFHDKKTGKCIVHDVKPETCVAGPITFDVNKKTGKIEWYIKMEKICSLAGAMHKNKKSLQEHLQSAKKRILRLVNELDSEALRAILKKEEVETFKIDEDMVEKQILDKLVTSKFR